MKDAIITVRLPSATKKRLELLAAQEGRSLSQQVERLVEQALGRREARPTELRGVRDLAGALRGGRVPTFDEFREARAQVSASLARRTRP